MSVIFNGRRISNILYNGEQISTLVFNGVEVFNNNNAPELTDVIINSQFRFQRINNYQLYTYETGIPTGYLNQEYDVYYNMQYVNNYSSADYIIYSKPGYRLCWQGDLNQYRQNLNLEQIDYSWKYVQNAYQFCGSNFQQNPISIIGNIRWNYEGTSFNYANMFQGKNNEVQTNIIFDVGTPLGYSLYSNVKNLNALFDSRRVSYIGWENTTLLNGALQCRNAQRNLNVIFNNIP